MPVTRYAELCQHSGGRIAWQLTGGVGIVQCQRSDQWPHRMQGRRQLRECVRIACQSTACLKANPARYSPLWPLGGGPTSAALPVSPGTGTLAPAN